MTFTFADRLNDRKPWHAEDIEELHRLLALETPTPLVAKALGRSQEAVKQKARALDRITK
jgi:hypothetical protein